MTATGIGWTSKGRAALAAVALALPSAAAGVETHVTGRVTYGAGYRIESSDPLLLTGVNASAAGLIGTGSGGNADDGNMNYRRGDVVTRALKAYLDLSASEGGFSAFARVKAWHDFGLLDDARPWGNVPSGYAVNAPLSDRGAGKWTRFEGIGVQEAWLQQHWQAQSAGITLRAGQQNLSWGERTLTPGRRRKKPRLPCRCCSAASTLPPGSCSKATGRRRFVRARSTCAAASGPSATIWPMAATR
jgi:hypothetical protein